MTCLLSCFRALARFDRACFRLMHVCEFLGKYRLRLLHVDSGLPETELSQILPVETSKDVGAVRIAYLTGGEVRNGT